MRTSWVTKESPTGRLRWNGPILEQEWAIEILTPPRSREHEWRPVPALIAPPAETEVRK